MIKKIISPFFALALLVSTPAQAAPEKYTYDPAHTQIVFTVSHLGLSNSMGRFNKFSGDFTFDQAQPENSKANITIETNSLDMASADWDRHMKSPDFFNVEKFPTMTFTSGNITKTGDKTATMTGDLTMLGVTKPVTLNVTFNKADIHPMNKNHVAGFSLTGTLKRYDFGMSYALPGIGDEVNLMIQVEGIRQDFTKLPN